MFPAWAGATVLWDQNDDPGGNGATSQVGSGNPTPIDAQAADDFIVPAGQQWTIQTVDVTGQYELGSGPVQGVNLFIYSDSGGVPGARISGGTVPVANGSGPSFDIVLGTGVALAPGHYWLSFQVELNNFPYEAWDWKNRTAVSGSPALYRDNTGSQFPDCQTWMPRTSNVCADDLNHPDQMFSLSGVSGPVTSAPGPGTTAPPAAKKKKCKKKKKHHAAAAKKKKCKKKKR